MSSSLPECFLRLLITAPVTSVPLVFTEYLNGLRATSSMNSRKSGLAMGSPPVMVSFSSLFPARSSRMPAHFFRERSFFRAPKLSTEQCRQFRLQPPVMSRFASLGETQ